MANKAGRSGRNQPDYMAEKRGGSEGTPEDWMAEKELILEEKGILSKLGPFNWWIVSMLIAVMVIGIIMVIIIGSTSKNGEDANAQLDPTQAMAATVAASGKLANSLLAEGKSLVSSCLATDKVCANYPQAIQKLQQAFILKGLDSSLADQVRQELRNDYLSYSNQLFRAGTNSDTFRLGLVPIREAKTYFPNDKDVAVLEEKADIYQQGWSKLELGIYDKAAGLFKQIWLDKADKKFFDIGPKYFESLTKLADVLIKNKDPENAKFYLQEALNLNLGSTENSKVRETLSKYPWK